MSGVRLEPGWLTSCTWAMKCCSYSVQKYQKLRKKISDHLEVIWPPTKGLLFYIFGQFYTSEKGLKLELSSKCFKTLLEHITAFPDMGLITYLRLKQNFDFFEISFVFFINFLYKIASRGGGGCQMTSKWSECFFLNFLWYFCTE